jgi:hypothetical protein
MALLIASCTARTPAASADEPLWVGNAEGGDLLQFEETPWNTAFADRPEVVSQPEHVRSGQYAIRSSIPANPPRGSGICCGARSELEPKIENIGEGDDLYFGFSTQLSTDFPVDEAWQVITQWKQIEGSPPLSLNVELGEYQLQGGASHPAGPQHFIEPVGEAVPGTWVDWVVHIVFSSDSDVGFVEVWRDGQLVLPRFHPPGGTIYPSDETIYLKTGYYRNWGINEPGSVYYDDWRVGATLQSVARNTP